MGKAIDMTGMRCGMLTAIRPVESTDTIKRWLFRCDCGNEKAINAYHVRLGRIVSCGCYWTADKAEQHARKVLLPKQWRGSHKRSSDPVYFVWKTMRQRCLNANSRDYPHYGGRGIKICKAWDSFEQFATDMGARPEGLTLDRVDVNGDYEPGNCRWATWTEQQRNKRAKSKPS